MYDCFVETQSVTKSIIYFLWAAKFFLDKILVTVISVQNNESPSKRKMDCNFCHRLSSSDKSFLPCFHMLRLDWKPFHLYFPVQFHDLLKCILATVSVLRRHVFFKQIITEWFRLYTLCNEKTKIIQNYFYLKKRPVLQANLLLLINSAPFNLYSDISSSLALTSSNKISSLLLSSPAARHMGIVTSSHSCRALPFTRSIAKLKIPPSSSELSSILVVDTLVACCGKSASNFRTNSWTSTSSMLKVGFNSCN